jgi:hypothetical protein
VKQLQIIPQEGSNLYGAMVSKEIALSKANKGTFYRSGAKQRDRAKWAHKQYNGWVNLARGMGGLVLAEVRTKAGADQEWLLLHAFLGFLDRHFREQLLAVNIQFHE